LERGGYEMVAYITCDSIVYIASRYTTIFICFLLEIGERGYIEYEIAQLEASNKKLRKAIEATIPYLEDWIRTTGFGEVNQRDSHALALANEVKDDKTTMVF
jgi:hypothetical protein